MRHGNRTSQRQRVPSRIARQVHGRHPRAHRRDGGFLVPRLQRFEGADSVGTAVLVRRPASMVGPEWVAAAWNRRNDLYFVPLLLALSFPLTERNRYTGIWVLHPGAGFLFAVAIRALSLLRRQSGGCFILMIPKARHPSGCMA